MVYRSARICAAVLAAALLFVLAGDRAGQAQAVAPSAGIAGPVGTPTQSLLHKADVFRDCQEIYWCGVRRDGRPYCGPAQRCRTCRFVRTCSRVTGCVWEEKCRWGPYVPPQPQ